MEKESKPIHRFRINPVEILIFVAVLGLFGKSVYSLIYSTPEVIQTPIQADIPAANPLTEGRSPASVSQAFSLYDFKCDQAQEQAVLASKIRLSGPICGMNSRDDSALLSKSLIQNSANKFNATVFTDLNAARFSTDYIPLNLGKNPIQVEFIYRDGRVVSQKLMLIKESL